jgi:hypothetical protein
VKLRHSNLGFPEAIAKCAGLGNLDAPFPLTPTLSLGERELPGRQLEQQRSPGNCRTLPKILPLPRGEGRGEGKGRGKAFAARTHAIASLILNMLVVAFFAALPLQAATNSGSENEILKLSPPHAELPASFREQYGFWIVIGTVVLLALVVAAVWWMLRPKPSIPAPIEILSRKELEALCQRSEDGRVLSQVSRVLRRYVTGAFGLPPDELTTSEFCRVSAAHEKIGPDLAVRVGDFLRQCDKLKFAPAGRPMPIGAAARALELVELGEARRAYLRKLDAESAAQASKRA